MLLSRIATCAHSAKKTSHAVSPKKSALSHKKLSHKKKSGAKKVKKSGAKKVKKPKSHKKK